MDTQQIIRSRQASQEKRDSSNKKTPMLTTDLAEIFNGGSTPMTHTDYVYSLISITKITLADKSQTCSIPQLINILNERGLHLSIDKTEDVIKLIRTLGMEVGEDRQVLSAILLYLVARGKNK